MIKKQEIKKLIDRYKRLAKQNRDLSVRVVGNEQKIYHCAIADTYSAVVKDLREMGVDYENK